ncbi:MAG: polysaccharide deacetylase [Bacteroidetes bacterium]|nr:MAG: polysaccharide deacetylase [Bacteroidota bacterium]
MRKIAYLTIDDSPSKDMKVKVNFLYTHKIPAVWFCIGEKIEINPEPVIIAIQKGYIIGNHSYSHRHFSKLSLDECKDEIRKTDEIIEQMYEKADCKRTIKIFRFPFGDKGVGWNPIKVIFRKYDSHFKNIQNYLSESGYQKVLLPDIQKWFPYSFLLNDIDLLWSYNIREWAISKKITSESEQKKFLLKKLSRLERTKKDEIILVHDQEITSHLFGFIINQFVKMDYHFKLPL